MASKTTKDEEIQVIKVNEGQIDFYVLGKSPLILNRMSEKAARELLLPRKKTAADKAANLKHNPPEEYRGSVYRDNDPEAPARVLLPATAFKGAMRSAAIDLPGAAKAQIGRLTYVPGDYVHIFGVPKLLCAITRSADMNKTPDVRTRAIVPEWCAKVSVRYVKPLLNDQTVANLLAAAGIIRGVGDGRPEKGWGSYGQFTLVNKDDADFARILKTGGAKAQDAALGQPEAYDAETSELLTWFSTEATRRGFAVA